MLSNCFYKPVYNADTKLTVQVVWMMLASAVWHQLTEWNQNMTPQYFPLASYGEPV